MSIRIMSLIFEANFDECIAPPRTVRASTAALVCLALADHANDEGKGAYPSIDRLASKTKLSRRSIIYTLDALQEAGIIHKVGYSEYGTANYTINIAKLVELSQKPIPIYGGASDTKEVEGCASDTLECASDTQKDASLAYKSSLKPSLTKHGESSKTELSPERKAYQDKIAAQNAQTVKSTQAYFARQSSGEVDFSWLGEGLVSLARAFVRACGFEYMPTKGERTHWRKVLLEWQEIGITDDIIARTVQKMKTQGLNIAGVQSITGMARSVMASSTQGQGNLPPEFHSTEEQVKSYKEQFGI